MTDVSSPTTTPVNLTPGRPPAPAQRPLLASQRLHPDAPAQNMALLTHLDGPIDPERLCAAFATVVAASDALRTRIVDDGGRQRVVLDATAQDPEVVEIGREEAGDWAAARAAVPVDLAVRGHDSVVLRHPDGTCSWYLALHHAVTDATSSALVFQATAAVYHHGPEAVDLASYYRWAAVPGGQSPATTPATTPRRDGPDAGPDPRHETPGEGGPDHAAAVRRQRALDHWAARVAPPPVDRLYRPLRQPAPAADRVPVPLDGDTLSALTARLGDVYRMLTPDLALTTVLLTATAVQVNRLSGADRFAVGVPVHNRSDAATRRLIGPVMEVFPVDVVVEPGDTFRSLHKRTARALLAALGRAEPGTAPAGDHQVVVNVIPRAALGPFGQLDTTTRWIHPGAMDAGHLLRLQCTAYAADDGPSPAGSLSLWLDLNRSVAGDDHLGLAPGHFLAVLDALVADPDREVALDLTGPSERAAITGWETGPDPSAATTTGPTGSTPPAGEGVVALLRSGLAGSDRIALTEADRSWTGDQLWREVLVTATNLAEIGVKPGIRVGLEVNRNAGAVIAILAVLVAGGSFVPLDPTHPRARRRRLRHRAGCDLLLDESPLSVDGDDARGGDDARSGADAAPLDEPGPDDEAYLLFTSGSSGGPKGVPILHRGLAAYLRFARDAYLADLPTVDGHPDLVVPLFTSLGFDLTITSLFLPLIAGGELVVIADDGAAALSTLAATTRVTWCKATPSHLDVLVRLLPADHRLSTLVVGGEAFGSGLARRLLDQRPGLVIFNEYGPTEAVVGCMIHRVEAASVAERPEVPIGVPAPGVTLRIVGPDLVRQPLGAAGELCIASPGLTSGYLDGVDADRFVLLDGARFYRSGDLVRLDTGPAGDPLAIYLGRIDDQVKVGGIRLEPTEVEDALRANPAIAAAAVRHWSPRPTPPRARCRRCGLADTVPGADLDSDGVCATCHAYDRVAPQATSWFRTEADLVARRDQARATATGGYDCLHLLSGGKDSTYSLYRLVDLGFRPFVFTLDNGYLSDEAKANISRVVADLGVDHEFATTAAMDAIFRDSLERHSNVCHGCYKTIYTLATTRAVELGIPLIVTGLSRGQLFETRLIPQQFRADRFDPEAIDRAVLEARKTYHRIDDGPNRLLDTSVFADDDVFATVEYLDFYRYVDVELAELLRYLDERAPWVRPSDTGRSTNCLINAAGIHTHLTEQGYHNYAVPYAWDVRLGHKTRAEAIAELDDRLDLAGVTSMLAGVGYEPRPTRVLTAWVVATPGFELPTPAELRAHLAGLVPAHAIPAAFVALGALPLTVNGKLDSDALPPPERTHRSGTGIDLAPTTELEATIVEVWERVLRLEPVGVTDDFFALGGDSLAALEMMAALADVLGRELPDRLAFTDPTPRDLAAAVAALFSEQLTAPSWLGPWSDEVPPPLGDGELALLYEQARRPDDVLYNLGRLYRVDGAVDAAGFADALRRVAADHVPLRWSYGPTRTRLEPEQAVVVERPDRVLPAERLDALLQRFHRRPFDLATGPLLRCLVQPVDDGTTAVLLVVHHVSADAGSFDVLWAAVDRVLDGAPVESPELDYPSLTRWQAESLPPRSVLHFVPEDPTEPTARLTAAGGRGPGPNGFATRVATVSPSVLLDVPGGGLPAALAAVAAVVRRHGDTDPVEIGVLTSTRNHRLADPLVGYFLTTLPVRLDCSPDRGLDDLLDESRTAVTANLANRTVPYGHIVAERRQAGVPRPGVDILLAFDRLPELTLGGRRVEQRVLSNGSAVADATFFVEVRPDRVELSIEYRGSVLDQDRAATLLADVDRVLCAVVDGDGSPLGELELTGAASILLGAELNGSAPVLDAILANVERRGTGPAVVCDGTTVSWAELGSRSADLASRLLAAGVVRGDRVVVALPRSTDLVVAMVAVLRAGAVYVPVDIGYPAERIRLIVEQAAPAAVVSAGGSVPGASPGIPVLVPTDPGDGPRPGPDGPVLDAVDPADTAYVIFTSGSTGRPRGVPVSHANLAASTAARDRVYPERPDRFLTVSSPSFDSSIVGLFWPLVAGGTTVLPTDREAHDPDALLDLFSSGRISHVLTVPTLYQALLERGRNRDTWPARVIVAGEACPRPLVERHHLLRPHTGLTNEYGPTEATVWATAHHCRPGDGPVAIGPPIPGTWVAVVDDAGRPVPVGVAGQLVIGGAGVVAGYLDDPSATADRFITAAGDRVFATGDRAVIADETVWFLGRTDDQLNVGGARVEPADIEQVITAAPGVGAAVVVAVDPRPVDQLLADLAPTEAAAALSRASRADDPGAELLRLLRTGPSARPVLVAHLEPAGDLPVDSEAVRLAVAAALPAALRPSRYQVADRLPRSANGKIDRAAATDLPLDPTRPDEHRPATVAPSTASTGQVTPLTRRVAALFAAALGLPRVEPDRSFFDLGGTSLSAMDLLLRLEAETGVAMTVSTLYDHPTPATASRWFADHPAPGAADTGAAVAGQNRFLVPIQPRGDRPPIFGIHVLGDNSSFYRPLAARLGPDQPVWGLGLPTLLPDTSGPTEVTEVAASYADELERCHPVGAVTLAAVSLGSVVAFELAQELERRGREVALLALFDASGPHADDHSLTRAERLAIHRRELRRSATRYVLGRAVNVRARLERRAEQAAIRIREAAGLPLQDHLRVRDFVEANWRSQLAYEFEPYDGAMVLFKAGDDPFTAHLADVGGGWSPVVTGPLVVDTVPGGHLSMLAEPHVATLAARLARHHERANRALDDPTGPGTGARGATGTSGPVPGSGPGPIEARLVAALHGGRLPAEVERLGDDGVALTSGDRQLVERCRDTLRYLAESAGASAREAAAVLNEAGLDPRVAPGPGLLPFAAADLILDGALDRAVEALAPLGYRIQTDGAASNGRRRITIVGADTLTTRINLIATGDTGDTGEGPTDAADIADDLFLGTPPGLAAEVVAVADPTGDDLLVDLGCGDGRVLEQAATRYGVRGRGVELDAERAGAARLRIEAAGLTDRVEIVVGDAEQTGLDDATVIFLFLPPPVAARLLPGLLGRLRPGARVVAHEQLPVPWPVPPDVTRLVVGDDGVSVAHRWDVSG